jgi:hypothetical protein
MNSNVDELAQWNGSDPLVKKHYVVYWTRMEGFLFQSVPDLTAALACIEHRGYHSWIVLEVPNDDS